MASFVARLAREISQTAIIGISLLVSGVCFGADAAAPDSGANALMAAAVSAQNAGDLARAEKLDREALDTFARAGTSSSAEGLTCLINLGVVLSLEGRLREAEEADRNALAILKTQPVGAELAGAWNGLGSVLSKTGRAKGAESAFRTAIGIWKNLPGPVHPQLSSSLANLGTLLASQRRWSEATQLLNQALEIDTQVLPPGDRRIAIDLNDQAGLYFTRKHYREAEQLLLRAKAVLDHQPSSDTTLGEVLANLGEVNRHENRLTESRANYAAGFAILTKAWGQYDRRLLVWLGGYAAVLRATEDYTEAEKLDVQATRIKLNEGLRKSS